MKSSKVGSNWSKLVSSEGWLTVAEAAGYLKVSRDFVYRAAERTEMPATKLGRQWRFRRDWLDEWLTAKRRGPAATPLAGGHSIARDVAPAVAAHPLASSSTPPAWRLALDEFVQEVRRLYGPRLRKVLLYGSHARGDARPGSDVDVAVILDDFESRSVESHRLGDLAWDYLLDRDVFIDVMPIRERDLANPDLLFYENLRREGVSLP